MNQEMQWLVDRRESEVWKIAMSIVSELLWPAALQEV
jgi:hypothetical protein